MRTYPHQGVVAQDPRLLSLVSLAVSIADVDKSEGAGSCLRDGFDSGHHIV